MAGRFATARDLLHRLTADAPSTSKLVAKGREAALAGEGGHSLFAWPFLALARKLKGKESFNKALYEHYHRPLKNIDEKAGAFIAKHTGAKKLFGQVDVLPTGRKMGGNSTLIEHKTHSATAPVTKVVKAVTPLAATLWVANKMAKKEPGDMETKQASKAEDKDALLKLAADALETAERRENAEKLAFKMVERGKLPPFGTYDEFQEKVASLLAKDLKAVEEAIDMDGQLADFGKVAEEQSNRPGDPTNDFYHRLAGE